MSKPGYKDLGISSKEYEEALLLERLFKLVKKNPCSTCLLKKPTHIDLDRYDLLCTTCSKRCSSKVQIGKGLISMADLERLESIYDKSKKKGDRQGSKPKKHAHRARSPSVSSYGGRARRKHDKHAYSDSESSARHHSKPKSRAKKKESHRHQAHDHYPDPYERYPAPVSSSDGYPKPYSDERYSPPRRPRPEKGRKDRSRGRDAGPDGYPGMEGRFSMERPAHREYDPGRGDRRDAYAQAQAPGYPYYAQPRYPEQFPDAPAQGYKYAGHMARNQTAYDYAALSRREVPGMMGLVSSQQRGGELVVRSQLALPPAEDKSYRKEHKSQSLALTNGFQAFRSVQPAPKEERLSNNPFARRNFEPPAHAYDFSSMREALNPRGAHARYQESLHHRDFPAAKLGNPGFPDSGAKYHNRY